MSTPLETLTFRQAAERYPAFSEAALRWLRFNGVENGFDACVIKLGRRVLLETEAFERWLASHKVSGVVSSTTEAAEKLGPIRLSTGTPRKTDAAPRRRQAGGTGRARDDTKQKSRASPRSKSARRTSSGRNPAQNEIERTT